MRRKRPKAYSVELRAELPHPGPQHIGVDPEIARGLRRRHPALRDLLHRLEHELPDRPS